MTAPTSNVQKLKKSLPKESRPHTTRLDFLQRKKSAWQHAFCRRGTVLGAPTRYPSKQTRPALLSVSPAAHGSISALVYEGREGREIAGETEAAAYGPDHYFSHLQQFLRLPEEEPACGGAAKRLALRRNRYF